MKKETINRIREIVYGKQPRSSRQIPILNLAENREREPSIKRITFISPDQKPTNQKALVINLKGGCS